MRPPARLQPAAALLRRCRRKTFLSLCASARTASNLRHYVSNTQPLRSSVGASPYTADRYPNLKRNAEFKTVDKQDIAFFQSVIASESGVLTADRPEELEPFNEV